MKVIAFCGIDGAGKSTQIKRVEDELIQFGHKVYMSKVAYYPFHLYQNEMIGQYEIRVNMAFDFAKHYLDLLPKLERQGFDYILCDRHALCHLAFAMTYKMDAGQIEKLDAIFGIGGHPDLTLYFDIPLKVALARIQTRADKLPDADEAAEILGPTLQHYRELIMTPRFNDTVYIDATRPPEEQTRFILRTIQEMTEHDNKGVHKGNPETGK